ncbi:SRPBCC family protein [Marivita sp.]|uniref:SRPBCC family protein n=1 Tax=Marivita sp. TaxID=2003365 RepID=UPI0025C1F25D|nr:SRPBCC family protein [Marivita sp.]
MQVTATEDVAAPIDHVFSELTDFETFERRALRRGIDVRRTFRAGFPEIGDGWEAKFRFRGKERTARIALEQLDPPQAMQFSGACGGLETVTQIELLPLSLNRTRVTLLFKMHPNTLSARLLVQTFKLARSNINKKLKARMSDYARAIESKVPKSA